MIINFITLFLSSFSILLHYWYYKYKHTIINKNLTILINNDLNVNFKLETLYKSLLEQNIKIIDLSKQIDILKSNYLNNNKINI